MTRLTAEDAARIGRQASRLADRLGSAAMGKAIRTAHDAESPLRSPGEPVSGGGIPNPTADMAVAAVEAQRTGRGGNGPNMWRRQLESQMVATQAAMATLDGLILEIAGHTENEIRELRASEDRAKLCEACEAPTTALRSGWCNPCRMLNARWLDDGQTDMADRTAFAHRVRQRISQGLLDRSSSPHYPTTTPTTRAE